MSDEQNGQLTPESKPQTPTEPETTPQPEPAPIPTENPVSEPNPAPVSPQEPIPDAPTPPTDSTSSQMSPEAPRTSPNPESATPVKDDISANEPFDETQGKPSEPAPEPLEQSNITVEKHGNDVTITEVMKPTAPNVAEAMPDKHSEPATAQMAGNEPIDLAEEIKIKKRQVNLKLANETRQEKKREKIDKIFDLFAERQTVTNDEVEKLLHVSDATATRYLETLEKEGKIKQIGKTGKGVSYTKI